MIAAPHPAIGTYAVVAAATAVVVAPLLALAYFGTADGAQYLEQGSVAAWAVPAGETLGGLVGWASPDRRYATYTQLMAVMFPAIPLLAAVVRRARLVEPRTRPERVGWMVALIGYSVFAVALLAQAVLLVSADSSSGVVDVVYLGLMVPGMLLSVIGSTVLGVALVRGGHTPRLTAWLLVLALPLLVLGSGVGGHNGLGLVPLFVAWGATGARLLRAGRPLGVGAPAVG